MGILFGTKPPLETMLHETQTGTKFSEWRRQRTSRRAAELIIKNGGETHEAMFLFAMYGVHPEYPRNKREKYIANRHNELLDQFRDVTSSTVVARMAPPPVNEQPNPYSDLFIAGVPVRRYESLPPLHFTLKPGRNYQGDRKESRKKYTEYIRGIISVSVSGYHHWNHKGELTQADEGTIPLLEVGRDRSGEGTSTYLPGTLAIGLGEILATHAFDQEGHSADDATFLTHLALVANSALALRQAHQPGQAAS